MERKLIIAGVGGQGVVFATRLLTQAAVNLGWPVMASETHGMSQRGGSVLSHLKFGGNEAPLIQRGTADALLALDADEAVRNLVFVRRGGKVFVNAEEGLRPEVAAPLERLGVRVYALPANRLATELGTVAIANVVLVGFVVAQPDPFVPCDAVREALQQIATRGRELNLEALAVGYRAGQAELGVVASGQADLGEMAGQHGRGPG